MKIIAKAFGQRGRYGGEKFVIMQLAAAMEQTEAEVGLAYIQHRTRAGNQCLADI